MERKVSGTTLINLERSDGGEGSSPNEKNHGDSGKSESQKPLDPIVFSFDPLKQIISDEPGSSFEKTFVGSLNSEVKKVNDYFTNKVAELSQMLSQIKKRKTNENVAEDSKKLENIASSLIQLEKFQRETTEGLKNLLDDALTQKGPLPQLKQWRTNLVDQPFISYDLETLLLKLSDCWTVLRTGKDQLVELPKEEGEKKPQKATFIRKTSKYWVPQEHLFQVQCMIIQHLPIFVFGRGSNKVKKPSAQITSVYFDSKDLVLYHDRIKRLEGATLVRIRRYGHGKGNEVFVERKTHHESWVGESSDKRRFSIKEKNLVPWLQGKYEYKGDKKGDKEASIQLARSIYEQIQKYKLEPRMTTRYHRTAFQLDNDDSTRISLDSRLHMIVEEGYKHGGYCRDHSKAPLSDIHYFPYGVLEVKLHLENEGTTPAWVSALLDSGLVAPAPKFSKYIQGCVKLLPHLTQAVPSWLERLPSEPYIPLIRPTSPPPPDTTAPPSQPKSVVIEIKENQDNKKESNRVTPGGTPEPVKSQELVLRSNGGDKKKSPFFGKKVVQVPIRVEPKSFFANERTMIQWLSFLILLITVGVALFNFGNWMWGGLSLIIIALIFMLYALWVYERRRIALQNRMKGPYDDKWAPVILVCILWVAVIANVVAQYLYVSTIPYCTGTRMLSTSTTQFKPYDVMWHSESNSIVFVGKNLVSQWDQSSKKFNNFLVGGNFVGVTSIPDQPNILYLAQEEPPTIKAFDLETRKVVGSYAIPIPDDGGLPGGLLSIAWVPLDGHQEGGVFWLGARSDPTIFVYEIPVKTHRAVPASLRDVLIPVPGLNNITGLFYDSGEGKVYAAAQNWLFTVDITGALDKQWILPFEDIGGVTLDPDSNLLMTCAACTDVWRFAFNTEDGIKTGACVEP